MTLFVYIKYMLIRLAGFRVHFLLNPLFLVGRGSTALMTLRTATMGAA